MKIDDGRWPGRPGAALLSIAAFAFGAAGCGTSAITSDRIEASIAPTFANLVQVQVDWLGLPRMAAADFAVSAQCRKLLGDSQAGSGEWVCTVVWKGPQQQTLTDTYELFVMTDGCYSASVGTENLGGPMLKAKDGHEVRNLLYAFEGCFDTTT
jgi:hypothetical protein